MKNKQIHFIGICGVAMSALALAFKRAGWIMTGSDVGFYPPISTHLKDENVDYYPGWHPERVLAKFKNGGSPDQIVVVGNVAGSQNPEWLYVQEHKLTFKSYPEIIEDFFIKTNSIVCAGTYGKSTSTTLLTWILQQSGFNPSYMFGGLSQNDLPAARLTDSYTATDWSVVEGDEYKASRWDTGPKFAYYAPTHLLLTSIIWDHADVYPTEASYINAFQKLFDMVPKKCLRVLSEQAKSVLDNNAGLTSLFKILSARDSTAVTYGRKEANDYFYTNIIQTAAGITFDIIHKNKTYTVVSSCLGDYMADNITGCFALADQIGIAPEKIIAAIATFRGMKRRLEKRLDGSITIFDDIAHSPAKATSVLQTLKNSYPGKLIAVFEPNTGNRRPEAIPGYDNAFAAAGEVIIPRLTKVKQADNEPTPLEGIDLATIIKKTQPKTAYIDDDTELVARLAASKPGTTIVFLGSHGFRGMIETLVKKLK